MSGAPARAASAASGWLFAPAPLARVALLRLVVFAFVVLDVLVLHADGRHHGAADPAWYRPLLVGELLHLPPATVLLAEALRWGSAALAVAATSGRAPRLLGWATAVSWSWFQYVSFSYGKVDHDRADFLVALFLLPTVGLAHLSDARRSEAAGFALRAVQLMAIATYFLSAVAKVRFGGWGWVDSATIARAVVRRGSEWVQWTLDVPWTLHALQWVLFTAELTSPVVFVLPERWRRRAVLAWYAFHAATYAGIGIAFWPHLVMMLAFLPLEAYRDGLAARWQRWRGASRTPSPRVTARLLALRRSPDADL